MKKLFKVSTGLKNCDGEGGESLNWSSYKVVAKSATEAIKKASAIFMEGEFLVGVELVCGIDIE